jgi:tetratricopeptide (TPR) repeat protein
MRARTGIATRGLLAILTGLTVSCAAPPPAPSAPAAEIQVTQTFAVARRAYEQGDFAQAQALYRQALLRARAIDHAALAADAAYNLAVSEIALQNYAAADQRLQEAGYDAARASTDTTEPLLLRAKVAYLRGRLPDAIALADQLIASSAAPALRRQALLLRGQIHAEAGDLATAREDLSSATQTDASTVAALAPAQAADAKKLEGTIALRDGNSFVAAQLFDAEAELLRTALRYRDMGRAYARAAEAYLAAGNAAPAADRFFLAGRSLDGLGDANGARAYLESSLAAAAQAGDTNALARTRALLDEISRRAGP